MSLSKSYSKSKNTYKVSFSIPKNNEKVEEVKLLGDFNNWDYNIAPQLKVVKGNYQVDIELEAGKTYEYRYCFNNTSWANDNTADAYVPSPFANIMNCVVDLSEIPATKEKAAPKKTVAKVVKTAKPKVEKLVKVDFTKIEGVGPKIAELLTKAGHTTYESIAKEKSEKIKEVLVAAGKRYVMHDPTTWPQQAKLLAAGKMDELKKLQDALKGGKVAK